jgi:TonB family protein
MEVTQIMNELADTDANVLAPPPDAQIRKLCTTFRRPFGLSMPQPKPGNGGQTEDVVVRGLVGLDGKIDQATVQSSDREDLNPEALDIAKQWTFTPAMCNGHPDMRRSALCSIFRAGKRHDRSSWSGKNHHASTEDF